MASSPMNEEIDELIVKGKTLLRQGQAKELKAVLEVLERFDRGTMPALQDLKLRLLKLEADVFFGNFQPAIMLGRQLLKECEASGQWILALETIRTMARAMILNFEPIDKILACVHQGEEILQKHVTKLLPSEKDEPEGEEDKITILPFEEWHYKVKYFRGVMFSLKGLAFSFFTNDKTAARDYMTRALKIFTEIGDKEGIAGCLLNLSSLTYWSTEKREDLIKNMQVAVELFESVGDLRYALIVKIFIAMYHQDEEKYQLASQVIQEILERTRDGGLPFIRLIALAMDIGIAVSSNDLERAESMLQALKKMSRSITQERRQLSMLQWFVDLSEVKVLRSHGDPISLQKAKEILIGLLSSRRHPFYFFRVEALLEYTDILLMELSHEDPQQFSLLKQYHQRLVGLLTRGPRRIIQKMLRLDSVLKTVKTESLEKTALHEEREWAQHSELPASQAQFPRDAFTGFIPLRVGDQRLTEALSTIADLSGKDFAMLIYIYCSTTEEECTIPRSRLQAFFQQIPRSTMTDRLNTLKKKGFLEEVPLAMHLKTDMRMKHYKLTSKARRLLLSLKTILPP